MKDYYQILQISKKSAATEIKKAYFKLVREYPSDRYPDQFMKIREAYEVLINEQTRQEYDAINSLPKVARLHYLNGLQAMEEKDPEKAIRYLEAFVYIIPYYNMINCLLGDAYLENKNSGKAIRIFEKLVAREPGNAGFVRRLAHSYSERGWHQKAIGCFRQALALDEDNLSLWMGLTGSYLETDDIASAIETLHEGLAVSNKKGWDNLTLYFQIIIIDLVTDNQEELNQHLQELKSKVLFDESNKTNTAWFLVLIADKLAAAGLHELAIDAIETASTLLPEDPEIASITARVSEQSRIDLKMDEVIDDPTIDNLLSRLLNCVLNHCADTACRDCQLEEFNLEMAIVMEMDSLRSDVARLKRKYPELYKLKAEFFDLVANRKKEKFLVDTYFKKLKYFKKTYPETFDDDDEEFDDEADGLPAEFYGEPYARAEPKVGRNEPCPCGSGKKYKKCCGR